MSDLVELRIDFSKDELENVKRAAELEGMTVDELEDKVRRRFPEYTVEDILRICDFLVKEGDRVKMK